MAKLPFEMGAAHYDQPPPDELDGLDAMEALRAEDRFRFANQLRAWIDVDSDGRIVDYGSTGGGLIGSTTVKIGRSVTVAAVPLPDRRPEPERGDGWVRFRHRDTGHLQRRERRQTELRPTDGHPDNRPPPGDAGRRR